MLPLFLDLDPTSCQISSPPDILLSELDQVALDFTLWPQEVAVTGGSPWELVLAARRWTLAFAAHHRVAALLPTAAVAVATPWQPYAAAGLLWLLDFEYWAL